MFRSVAVHRLQSEAAITAKQNSGPQQAYEQQASSGERPGSSRKLNCDSKISVPLLYKRLQSDAAITASQERQIRSRWRQR